MHDVVLLETGLSHGGAADTRPAFAKQGHARRRKQRESPCCLFMNADMKISRAQRGFFTLSFEAVAKAPASPKPYIWGV